MCRMCGKTAGLFGHRVWLALLTLSLAELTLLGQARRPWNSQNLVDSAYPPLLFGHEQLLKKRSSRKAWLQTLRRLAQRRQVVGIVPA
jgi:hypothetical protein